MTEEPENNSPLMGFWHSVVSDSATQMASFFSAAKDTIQIISSKAHMILFMYLLFLSAIFTYVVLFVCVNISICLAIAIHIFRWIT